METDRSESWLSRLTELIRARLFTSHSSQILTPSSPRSARIDSLDLERQSSEHSLSKDEKDNQNQPSSPSESAHLGPLNVTVRPGPATLDVSNNNNQSETNSERNGVEEHLPSVLPAPPPTTPSSARTEPHAPVDDLPDNQAILPPSTANPSGITPPTLPASLIDPELAPTTRLPGPLSQFSGYIDFPYHHRLPGYWWYHNPTLHDQLTARESKNWSNIGLIMETDLGHQLLGNDRCSRCRESGRECWVYTQRGRGRVRYATSTCARCRVQARGGGCSAAPDTPTDTEDQDRGPGGQGKRKLDLRRSVDGKRRRYSSNSPLLMNRQRLG